MVRYVTARYIDTEEDPYYKTNQQYPLAVKVRFFSRKVSVYKRRGYYDEMEPGTLREFRDIETFEKVFNITHMEGEK